MCTSISQQDTLAPKAACEEYTSTHGVKVEAYYVDKGQFNE